METLSGASAPKEELYCSCLADAEKLPLLWELASRSDD